MAITEENRLRALKINNHQNTPQPQRDTKTTKPASNTITNYFDANTNNTINKNTTGKKNIDYNPDYVNPRYY